MNSAPVSKGEFGLDVVVCETAKCFPVDKHWNAVIPIHHVDSLSRFFLGTRFFADICHCRWGSVVKQQFPECYKWGVTQWFL